MNAALHLWVPEAMELVKATGKRPLGRGRRRWEDNIRMGPNQSSAYDLISRHSGQ